MPGTGSGDTEIDTPVQAHSALSWAPEPGMASAPGVCGQGGHGATQLKERGPWGNRKGLTGPWVRWLIRTDERGTMENVGPQGSPHLYRAAAHRWKSSQGYSGHCLGYGSSSHHHRAQSMKTKSPHSPPGPGVTVGTFPIPSPPSPTNTPGHLLPLDARYPRAHYPSPHPTPGDLILS